MKLKTFKVFPPFFAFVLDNPLRTLIENPEKQVEFMGVEYGMKVLELGPARGFMTQFLSKKVDKKGFVISIDVQEKMIAKALRKRGYLSNVSFKVEDAADLRSIKDGEIDLIFLYYVFHEIQHKENAVKEFYRVLKKGGILSIKEPKLEVFKKDLETYKELMIKNSFRNIEVEKKGDLFGRFLKFIKD